MLDDKDVLRFRHLLKELHAKVPLKTNADTMVRNYLEGMYEGLGRIEEVVTHQAAKAAKTQRTTDA